jgi:hypothetical protein
MPFQAAKPGPQPDRPCDGSEIQPLVGILPPQSVPVATGLGALDVFVFRILVAINTGAVSPSFGTFGRNADGGAHRFFLGARAEAIGRIWGSGLARADVASLESEIPHVRSGGFAGFGHEAGAPRGCGEVVVRMTSGSPTIKLENLQSASQERRLGQCTSRGQYGHVDCFRPTVRSERLRRARKARLPLTLRHPSPLHYFLLVLVLASSSLISTTPFANSPV